MAASASSSPTRYAVGCMTGTSLDGLDVALTEIVGHGYDMTARIVGLVSRPLPDDLRASLRSFAAGDAAAPLAYLRAARVLGQLHAAAVSDVCERHMSVPGRLSFVAAHGQTIWHAPDEGLSWQLFDPWPLVRKLGVPVVYDLRQADLIAGGQGAPITPAADWVLYRDVADVVVNLGGICNVTWLGETPGNTTGGDVGPCNLLLDGLCRELFDQPFDRDGARAAAGTAQPAVQNLIADRIRPSTSHSLGRERYSDAWVRELAAEARRIAQPSDVLRSAVQAVAASIVERVQAERSLAARPRLVLAGGGARHALLVDAIRSRTQTQVQLSDEVGVPCEAREALAFAVLGALSADGEPITLPRITGSDRPSVAGTWAGRGCDQS